MSDKATEVHGGEDLNTSSSSLDTTVSRMLDDENIIDSFFYTCDTERKGTVAVSKLIEFIENTTDETVEGGGDIELLRNKLDPHGLDVGVDLDQCRRGVAEWIQDIRCRSLECDDNCDSDEEGFASHCSPKDTSLFTSSPDRSSHVSFLTSHHHSSEPWLGHYNILGHETEMRDVNTLVSDLQLQVKSLAEENTQLREQLKNNEDVSANFVQELDELRNTVKNHYHLVEKYREVQEENEELKSAWTSSEEFRLSLEDKVQHLTKEKSCLESHIEDMQNQLLQGMTELEQSERCHQKLQRELNEQKKQFSVVLEGKESVQAQYLEKCQQLEQLHEMAQDLNNICKVLKKERSDMKFELEEAQHQLLEAQAEKLDRSGSFAPVSSDIEEFSDAEDLMPVKLSSTSTRAVTPSLCDELQFSLNREDCLPSPMCSKEMQDVLSKTSTGEVQCDGEKSVPDCVLKVQDECNLTARHLHESVNLRPDGARRTHSTCRGSNQKLSNLEDEVCSFADKVTIMVTEKQDMQTRVTKLEDSLQQASENNDELRTKYTHLKHLLVVNFSGSLDEKVKQKFQLLRAQIIGDTEHNWELELQKETETTLQDELTSLKRSLKNAQEEKTFLQKQLEKLQSANADLLDKYERSESYMKNLKDDLEKKRDKDKSLEHEVNNWLDIEVGRFGKETWTEESSRAQTLKKQLDLKELFRIVQKDVEAECLSDGQNTPVTASTDSVRESVAKEIKKLRTKLARSQAAFAILHSKTISPNKGKKKLKRHNSPSSPLVEALTLDLFEGYQPEKNPAGKKREGCASVDSILDGHDGGEELDASFQLDALLAKSCPHLSHRPLVSCATQTEDAASTQKRRAPQIGTTRYTSVNTSTGSSTSGVVDLDFSSSSNKSEPHGIFSLPPKKSVLIVETTCSPDTPSSPEDPNDPLLRHRTSSFKRAIERGPSADSNQSAETCDPASTSPEDLTPDKPDLPPYPHPPPIVKDKASQHHQQHSTGEYTHSYGSHLNIPDYDPSIAHSTHNSSGDTGLTTKQSVLDALSNTFCDNAYYIDTSAVKDVYFVEDLHSRFKGPSIQEPTSLDVNDANCAKDEGSNNDVKQSPRTSRRLSTLVEEGSDAEADESLQQGHLGKSGRMLPPPKSPKPPLPIRKAPKLLDVPMGQQQQQNNEPSTSPKTPPPTYRSPPAYGDAVKRDPSPSRSHGDRSRSPSPRPSSVSPQGRSTVTHTVTVHSPKSDANSSPQPPVLRPNGVLHRYVAPEVRPVRDDTRRSDESSSRSPKTTPVPSPRTSTAVNAYDQEKDAKVPNGEVNDLELSEADKRFTEQLLEEAKKVSAQSKHRGKLSKRRSGNDLTRTQTFDDGDDDVFLEKVAGKLSSQSSDQPPRSPSQTKSHELSVLKWSVNFNKDSDGENKDISPTLNRCDPNANKPFRISANVQLTKLREENLAKKRNLTKQGNKMPDLSENSETESGKGSGASAEEGDNGGAPAAFPSLSNSVLNNMGLEHKRGDPLPDAEHMSEADVEEKFISLALAFKTDKMTLEKRIELHERSRDIAEQNVDKELEGLKESLKALSPFCNDAASRDVYNRIKHHVEVLEQSTVRVSSRAEVHGAVQQELRMSKAIDVMVQHVENLKRMYEREHAELEETRKLLHDNRIGDDLSKRSYSVVGSGLKLGGRRRSSAVVLPRRMSMATSTSTPNHHTLPDSPTQDPKPRFLATPTDTSLKIPAHPDSLRINSTEKPAFSSTPNHTVLPNGHEKSDLKGDVQLDSNRNIDQELIFQKGFEEGVRAQVSQEIELLRLQQQSFSDSIDQLLDQNEVEDEEQNVETLLDKMWRWWPAFEKSGQRVRFALASLVFLMALFSVIFTLIPIGSVSAARDPSQLHHTPWHSVQDILQPHLSLRYKEGNPPS